MVDVDCAVSDTSCLTAFNDFGRKIDEAEVIYWRPMSRVCRCDFGLVRRLKADA